VRDRPRSDPVPVFRRRAAEFGEQFTRIEEGAGGSGVEGWLALRLVRFRKNLTSGAVRLTIKRITPVIVKARIHLHSTTLFCLVATINMCLYSKDLLAERPQFTITEIGLLPGWVHPTVPFSINDAGDVVGEGQDPEELNRPFLLRNGVLRDIGGSASSGTAVDINNSGQILAYLHNEGAPNYSPVIISEAGILNLNYAIGTPFVLGAINDLGEVVGSRDYNSGGFVYSDGVVHLLGHGEDVFAKDINNHHQVAAVYNVDASLPWRAGIFEGDSLFALGLPRGRDFAKAEAINNRGQVAVNAANTAFSYHGFLYEAGHFTDLGTLHGDAQSGVAGINDDGDLVGSSGGCAFLYREGKMHDLNDLVFRPLGWSLEFAFRINNKGQIIGLGSFRGQMRGFLLTPAEKPIQGNHH
jgi:probable HAF family extracellular repeat protein